jgi:hypothetical protein
MENQPPNKELTTNVEDIEEGIPSIDKVEGTDVESKDAPQRRQGRPLKDIESIRRVPFSVSLSPKLVGKIADQADEEGVSRSELVNEAVAFYLDMHKPGHRSIFSSRKRNSPASFAKHSTSQRALRRPRKQPSTKHALEKQTRTKSPNPRSEPGPI